MRLRYLAPGLLAAFLLSVGAALSWGSVAVSPSDAFHVLRYHLMFGYGTAPEATVAQIVWNLRLPRVLLALVVGGGLAISGVAMQTLVRNPLAEPYILGISSGASAGVSLFYLGFLPPFLSQTLTIPLAAFLGGLFAILVVYLIARSGQTISVTRLLLAGVAMASLMGAVSSFVTFLSPDANKLRTVLFLLLGSLDGTRWNMVPLPSLITLAGLLTLWVLARPLDALLIGEEPAINLGIPVERIKHFLIVLAALITGSLVAVSGVIGFVGLIVPHAVRLTVGVRHQRLVPLSFCTGALFLLWADVAARTFLAPQELPLGILTALCGVPFFLALLRSNQYRFG